MAGLTPPPVAKTMVDSEPPSMKVEEAEALNWVWLGQVEAQRVPGGEMRERGVRERGKEERKEGTYW